MINEVSNNSNGALGVSSQLQGTGRSSSDMGQEDFLELMLAQMKNQDPTKPLDPNEFMSQLAEFSTVNGIQELQQSFDSLAAVMSTDQTLKAASMIGHAVMTPGDTSVLEEGGNIVGQALLNGSTADLNIKIYDSQGSLVRTIPMGNNVPGAVPFRWDGFTEDGSPAEPGNYRIVAEVEVDGSIQEAATEVRGKVDSVSLSPYGSILLNLDNGTSMPLEAIQTIM